jgi:hypothetical protein
MADVDDGLHDDLVATAEPDEEAKPPLQPPDLSRVVSHPHREQLCRLPDVHLL